MHVFFARDDHRGVCIKETVLRDNVSALKRGDREVLNRVLEELLVDESHRQKLELNLGITDINALVLKQFLEAVITDVSETIKA